MLCLQILPLCGTRFLAKDMTSLLFRSCVHANSLMSNSFWLYGLQPTRLPCPWDFPGKNTEVGCHALLEGIFLTHGLNPNHLCLLHQQASSLPRASLGFSSYLFFNFLLRCISSAKGVLTQIQIIPPIQIRTSPLHHYVANCQQNTWLTGGIW